MIDGVWWGGFVMRSMVSDMGRRCDKPKVTKISNGIDSQEVKALALDRFLS
jgi:hypothetical protein